MWWRLDIVLCFQILTFLNKIYLNKIEQCVALIKYEELRIYIIY
jgi:hypothetical protein